MKSDFWYEEKEEKATKCKKSRTQFENGFFMLLGGGLCLVCISLGVIAILAKYFEYKKERQNKNTVARRSSA